MKVPRLRIIALASVFLSISSTVLAQEKNIATMEHTTVLTDEVKQRAQKDLHGECLGYFLKEAINGKDGYQPAPSAKFKEGVFVNGKFNCTWTRKIGTWEEAEKKAIASCEGAHPQGGSDCEVYAYNNHIVYESAHEKLEAAKKLLNSGDIPAAEQALNDLKEKNLASLAKEGDGSADDITCKGKGYRPSSHGYINCRSDIVQAKKLADEQLAAQKLHGPVYGVQTYTNGDHYEGILVNGMRSGKGVYVWATGERYEGNWINNQPNGSGTKTWKNGDRYVGALVNGKMSGKGIYTWKDGDHFEGDFVDDKLSYGIKVNASGDIVGSYTNGEPHLMQQQQEQAQQQDNGPGLGTVLLLGILGGLGNIHPAPSYDPPSAGVGRIPSYGVTPSSQLKQGYQTRDANGAVVNSLSNYQTRDANGAIVNSQDNYQTRDSNGAVVNSHDNFQTRDANGAVVNTGN